MYGGQATLHGFHHVADAWNLNHPQFATILLLDSINTPHVSALFQPISGSTVTCSCEKSSRISLSSPALCWD